MEEPCLCWAALVLVGVTLHVPTLHATIETEEFCHNEVFEATCPPGEVIIMEVALYGRMTKGRCVRTDFGYVGCKTDVLDLVTSKCSGRDHCTIGVPSAMFDNTRPCNDDLKSYFEAGYRCLPVTTVTSDQCEESTHLKLTSQHGYLASYVTQQTSCGSHYSPWIIETRPGQRINFTVFDFSGPAEFSNTHGLDSLSCMKYATIRETSDRSRYDICAGSVPRRHVYTSLSNMVEVDLSIVEGYNFLLYYEVIGCPQLVRPPNTWVKMTETSAVVGCPLTGETWHVLCQGQTWLGDIGNCTGEAANKPDKIVMGTGAFSMGTSVLIVVVVAGVIGAVILMIGVLLLKKRGKHSASTRVVHHGGSHSLNAYKDALSLNKSLHPRGGGGGNDDYPLTTLPMHTAVDVQRRGAGPDGLNDYTYVWEAPGHCTAAAVAAGTGRFGAITVEAVDDCCISSCNNPGTATATTASCIPHDESQSSMNTKSIHNLMSSISPCHPQHAGDVSSTALHKQVEVDYSMKCGTLSTHVPATTYRACSMCMEPQQCTHNDMCPVEPTNRT